MSSLNYCTRGDRQTANRRKSVSHTLTLKDSTQSGSGCYVSKMQDFPRLAGATTRKFSRFSIFTRYHTISQISIAPSAPARSSLKKWLGQSGVGAGRVPVWVEDDAGKKNVSWPMKPVLMSCHFALTYRTRTAFTVRAKGKYNMVELPVSADAGGAFQRGSDNCIEYPLAGSTTTVCAHATRSLVSLQTNWACTLLVFLCPSRTVSDKSARTRCVPCIRTQSHTHVSAHFVANLMVAGHVKSVSSNDDAFIQCFRSSDKWLRIQSSPF